KDSTSTQFLTIPSRFINIQGRIQRRKTISPPPNLFHRVQNRMPSNPRAILLKKIPTFLLCKPSQSSPPPLQHFGWNKYDEASSYHHQSLSGQTAPGDPRPVPNPNGFVYCCQRHVSAITDHLLNTPASPVDQLFPNPSR